MPDPDPDRVADVELARLVRAESGLIVAQLHRRLGDFDCAEEAVQLAITDALRSWRRTGPPPNPGGWLATTARRRAIDLLRRKAREQRLIDDLGVDEPIESLLLEPSPAEHPDERLPMLFACCHPALNVEARIALTLRAVVGLTTDRIARSFLVSTATMAQRLVRAKRKITVAGISFGIPDHDQLSSRLDDVLTVVAVAYNESYLSTDDQGLAGDMLWLAELVARELVDQPEAWGLLALLTLQQARSATRFDAEGRLVLLSDQDRGRWDRAMIDKAERILDLAAHARRPGRFQLQAAIAACHAVAPSWPETDWLQIVTLYDLLLRHDPSPVIRLNHAVALSELSGPGTALTEVDRLADRLDEYYLMHAVRGRLLHRLGRHDEGVAANRRALHLAVNPVEQELLRARLAEFDV
ncbi:RNA polymerase sigma factor [Microlunatus speluncae]|uniref:RNA polymerase sigma factor n=1 Tax=Microlunatus speluncae TaxID=2594267 RepID=UPI001FE62D9B|nr:sigma-70 family RNA polymerase sigma factor [Microlunatus speluncae]